MNAIQQISLKLRMGIDPQVDISPDMLRAMWQQLLLEKKGRPLNVRKRTRTNDLREPVMML